MSDDKNLESQRASRICFMTDGFHQSVSSAYESLVDRDYDSAKKTIKLLMRDLRETLKLIDDDDF